MKILESQAAVLTNIEVYQHLTQQRDRNKKAKRRGPPNFETVVHEVLESFKMKSSPLRRAPVPYSPEVITTLLDRLRPYELSKGEAIMILNLRPISVAGLNTIIDDMGDRLTEDQQAEVLAIVSDVLGYTPPEEPAQNGDEGGEEDGDVSMGDQPES